MNNSELSTRYEGLDLLRGVAIISVVVYHFMFRFDQEYLFSSLAIETKLPLWLGVELFFIVSGFCIAFTLQRSGSLPEFWAARLARLQPAYIVAAVVTFAVVAVWGLPGREVDLVALMANLLWLNAAGAAPHVDGVYWSLVVELKFYVLIGLAWAIAPSPRALTLAWAVLCAASLSMSRVDTRIAGELMLFPYNFFFLIGLTLCHARTLSRAEVLGYLALAGLGVLEARRYEGVELWAFAVIALGIALARAPRIPFGRAVVAVGALSYTWYLIHQNVGLVIIREMNLAGFELIAIPLAVLGTMALAALLHVFVEFRFRRVLQARLAAGFRRVPLGAAVRAVQRGLVQILQDAAAERRLPFSGFRRTAVAGQTAPRVVKLATR